MQMFVICIALCVAIIIERITHYIERKDLYNRIMSRDVRDYEVITGKANNVPLPSSHRKNIDKWKEGGGSE